MWMHTYKLSGSSVWFLGCGSYGGSVRRGNACECIAMNTSPAALSPTTTHNTTNSGYSMNKTTFLNGLMERVI